MSSTFCPTYSSCAAFLPTCGPTTDRGSSPRRCRNGSQLSVSRPLTSRGANLGRTATSRASTPCLRDEAAQRRIFYTLRETRIVIESCRRHYNTIRPPRLNRIQATSTRGVRARLRRVAGCATPTGSAGHAGATANLKLTFHLDHSAGADHSGSQDKLESANFG